MVTDINGYVPSPSDFPTADEQQAVERALAQALAPGTSLADRRAGVRGVCTNARIEDLARRGQDPRPPRARGGARAKVASRPLDCLLPSAVGNPTDLARTP